jgi:hypothetical protein
MLTTPKPDKSQTVNMMDKVILMTPENIHLNSFMYPIIHLDHPAMMTRYGWGVVRAQA